VSHVMRELSAALLLQGHDNVTLAVLLFGFWSGGQPNAAAAVGVWLIVLMAVITAAWQWLAPSKAGGGAA
jgi:iron(III) transport system permease protein